MTSTLGLEPKTPAAAEDRERLLAEASALGIPWERIIGEEIRAEEALREYLAEPEECPLNSAFWILPRSLLQSFRVRDVIAGLSWEASMRKCPAAARQLRLLHEHLSGRSERDDDAPMARHLWFGYHRVLALQRICSAARKSRGDYETRVDIVCHETGCAPSDAQWAVRREGSSGRGHVLDDAMRRTREEGFELPTAESEVRAFRRLRQFVKSSPHLKPSARHMTDSFGDRAVKPPRRGSRSFRRPSRRRRSRRVRENANL